MEPNDYLPDFVERFAAHYNQFVIRGHELTIYDAIHLCIHVRYHLDELDITMEERLHNGLFKPDVLRELGADTHELMEQLGVNLYVFGQDSLRSRNNLLRVDVLKVADRYFVPLYQFGHNCEPTILEFIKFWRRWSVDYRYVHLQTELNEFITGIKIQINRRRKQEQIEHDYEFAKSLASTW